MGVIVRNPEILGGTPVFRGTRVPVQALFEYLEGGETLEEFLEGFPTVSRETAVAALEEAKELLRTLNADPQWGKDRGPMAALDWSHCPAVESIPGKVSGAWLFKGTRMPVAIVFQNLEAGATVEEIMEWFDLTREQIKSVLDFAARSLEAPVRR